MTDELSNSFKTEGKWNFIWKELDKRGLYERSAAPADHNPNVIFKFIMNRRKQADYNDVHPVDALFMGYFHRNFKETEQAVSAYQSSASRGNVDALIGLGTMSEATGDLVAAEKYFQDALEKGMMRAYNNLGLLYQSQKDFIKSFEMFTLGVGHGIVPCMYHASVLSNDPNFGVYDPERAKQFLDQGIELGCYFSMYYKGTTLCREESTCMEGISLIKRSAKLGYSYAMDFLVKIYRGLEDKEKYTKWAHRLIDKEDHVSKEFLKTIFSSNAVLLLPPIEADLLNFVNSLPDEREGCRAFEVVDK